MQKTYTLKLDAGPSEHLKVALEQLQDFLKAGTSKKVEELKWEILLYEWILKQENKDAMAREYMEARNNDGNELLPKRVVVKKLGWNIES